MYFKGKHNGLRWEDIDQRLPPADMRPLQRRRALHTERADITLTWEPVQAHVPAELDGLYIERSVTSRVYVCGFGPA